MRAQVTRNVYLSLENEKWKKWDDGRTGRRQRMLARTNHQKHFAYNFALLLA